jgi:uncharacterized protein (DUF302 family)
MFEERYTFGSRLRGPFDAVREAVVAALKDEGFGVLTEIDVAATLKAKLDVDRAPYRILGACNPPFAHRAIETDPAIGALLPCNVVIRADGDAVVVELMDPRAILAMVGRPEIDEMATEIRARLARVVGVVSRQFPVEEPVS